MKRAIVFTVGAQYLAVLLIQAVSGFRYAPPFSTFFGAALGFSVFAVGGVAVNCVLRMMRQRAAQPAAHVIALLKRSGDIPFIYFMVAAQLCVLGWLKAAMPYSVGFRFDQALADMDAAIFGADPWTLLTWLPAGALDKAYITWASATVLLMLVLPLLPKSSRRDRALLSYFLVVASASLGQYLVPSAGPIFYERIGLGDRFVDLPVQPWVQVTSDYLWTNYLSRGELVGVGISAFPSLHVGGAAWVAIVTSSYLPRLTLVGWAYFLAMFVGSVHLGWHYALDGIASVAIAVTAWAAAPALLRQANRSPSKAAYRADTAPRTSGAFSRLRR